MTDEDSSFDSWLLVLDHNKPIGLGVHCGPSLEPKEVFDQKCNSSSVMLLSPTKSQEKKAECSGTNGKHVGMLLLQAKNSLPQDQHHITNSSEIAQCSSVENAVQLSLLSETTSDVIDISDDDIQFIEEVPASKHSGCVLNTNIKHEKTEFSPPQHQLASKLGQRLKERNTTCNLKTSESTDVYFLSDGEVATLETLKETQLLKLSIETDECNSRKVFADTQLSKKTEIVSSEFDSENVASNHTGDNLTLTQNVATSEVEACVATSSDESKVHITESQPPVCDGIIPLRFSKQCNTVLAETTSNEGVATLPTSPSRKGHNNSVVDLIVCGVNNSQMTRSSEECVETLETSQPEATNGIYQHHLMLQTSNNSMTRFSETHQQNTISNTQLHVTVPNEPTVRIQEENNIPSPNKMLLPETSHKRFLCHSEGQPCPEKQESLNGLKRLTMGLVSYASSSDSSISLDLHLNSGHSPCSSLQTTDVEYLDSSNSGLSDKTEHETYEAHNILQETEISSDKTEKILHSKINDETYDSLNSDGLKAKKEEIKYPIIESTTCPSGDNKNNLSTISDMAVSEVAQQRPVADIKQEVKPLMDRNSIVSAPVSINLGSNPQSYQNVHLDPSYRKFIASLPSIKRCADLLKMNGNELLPKFSVSNKVEGAVSSTELAVSTASSRISTPKLCDATPQHQLAHLNRSVFAELSTVTESSSTNSIPTSSTVLMIHNDTHPQSSSLMKDISTSTSLPLPSTPSTVSSSSPTLDNPPSSCTVDVTKLAPLVEDRSVMANATSENCSINKISSPCDRAKPRVCSTVVKCGSSTFANGSTSSKTLTNLPERSVETSSIGHSCDQQSLKRELNISDPKKPVTKVQQTCAPTLAKQYEQPCPKPSFAVRALKSLFKTTPKSLFVGNASRGSNQVPLPQNLSELEKTLLDYNKRPPLQPLKRNEMFRGVVLLGDERYNCIKKAWEQPLSKHPLQAIVRPGLTLSGTQAVVGGFLLEHLMTASSSKTFQQLMIVCTIGWRDLIKVNDVDNRRKEVRLAHPRESFVSSVITEIVSASNRLRSLLSSPLKGAVVFAHLWPVNILQYEEFINRKSMFILNKKEQEELQEMSNFLLDRICHINRELSRRHLTVHCSLPYDLKRKAVTHWNIAFNNISLINGIIPYQGQVDIMYKRLQDLYSMYVYKIENITKFSTLFIVGDTRLKSLSRAWPAKSRLVPVFILSDEITPDNFLEVVELHCCNGDTVIFAPSVRHMLLTTKVNEDDDDLAQEKFEYPTFSDDSHNIEKNVSMLLKTVKKQHQHPNLSQVTIMLSCLAPFDLQEEVRSKVMKYNSKHSRHLSPELTLNAGLEEDDLLTYIDKFNDRLVEACVVANIPVTDVFARGSWSKDSGLGTHWEGRALKTIFDSLYMYKLSSDSWNQYKGPKESTPLSVQVTLINLADDRREVISTEKLSSKIVYPGRNSKKFEDSSLVDTNDYYDSLRGSSHQESPSSKRRRRSLSCPRSSKDHSSKHGSSRYLDDNNDRRCKTSKSRGHSSSSKRQYEAAYDDQFYNLKEPADEDHPNINLSLTRRRPRRRNLSGDKHRLHNTSAEHCQRSLSRDRSRDSSDRTTPASGGKVKVFGSSSSSTKKSRHRARPSLSSSSSSSKEHSLSRSRSSLTKSHSKKKRKKKSSETKPQNEHQKKGISQSDMSELLNLSLSQLKRIHASEWDNYRRWPHTHPTYTKELAQFFSLKRNAERFSKGLDEGDVRAEWQEFWAKRMDQIEEEDLRSKIKEFEKKAASDLWGFLDTNTTSDSGKRRTKRSRSSSSSSFSGSEDDHHTTLNKTKHKSRKRATKSATDVKCGDDDCDERAMLLRVKTPMKEAMKISPMNCSIMEANQCRRESTSGDNAIASSSTVVNLAPSPASPPSPTCTVEPSAVLKFAIHLTPKIGLLASALPLMLTKVLDAESSCLNPLDAVAGEDLTLLCLVQKQLETVAIECAPVDGIVVLECLKHLRTLIAAVRQNIEVDIRKTAIETMGMDSGNIIMFLVKHLRELNSKQDIMSVYKKVVREHKRMKKYMSDNPSSFKFSV